MAGEATMEKAESSYLKPARVYMLAGICLVLGLAIGYVLRGPQTTAPQTAPSQATAGQDGGRGGRGHAPTAADLKRMADTKAGPLLEALKSNPNDPALLAQVGAIYHAADQFQESAAFYGRAVKLSPKDVALRTKLASSLYRSGDADGAIAQLNQALRDKPNDANSLFNLGLIRWQGKQDGKGALAAWQRLLNTNPKLSVGRKAEVQKLMTSVTTALNSRQPIKGTGQKEQ